MPSATGTKVVPLISSASAGPLGAIHLPRLWSKLTLHNAGMLADGYDFCGQGFDQMTLDGLGLDKQRVLDYVAREHPTYMQFEAWVIAEKGGAIPRATIDAHNAAIRGYTHTDDDARKMRAASGVQHEHINDAVTLNSLEDLDELHANAQHARAAR